MQNNSDPHKQQNQDNGNASDATAPQHNQDSSVTGSNIEDQESVSSALPQPAEQNNFTSNDTNNEDKPLFYPGKQPEKDQITTTISDGDVSDSGMMNQVVAGDNSKDTSGSSGFPKKAIATILGIILLVAGVGVGVYLVNQQTRLRTQAWYCDKYVFDVSIDGTVVTRNGSTRNEPPQKAKVYINGDFKINLDVPRLNKGEAATIGNITVPDDGFTWKVIGTIDCKNSGKYGPKTTPTPPPTATPTTPVDPTPTSPVTATPTVPVTLTPTSPPTATPTVPENQATCFNVRAFDTNWNELSSSSLANLGEGDIVRFAVGGSADSGFFDKARFTINGTLRSEVTDKRPGTDEFYDEYTIPGDMTNFTVNAEIHHSTLGWF